MTWTTRLCRRAVYCLACLLPSWSGFAQETAFTYQGRLSQSGVAVTAMADFEFRLFAGTTDGSPVADAVAVEDVPITNGLFTVRLDFGASFSGAPRFLEIGVRDGADSGPYVTLAPRQPVTSVPYAVRALEAAGVPAGAITSAMLEPGAVTQLGSPDGSPVNALQVNPNGWIGLGTNSPHAGLHLNAGDLIYAPKVLFAQQDEENPFGADALAGASAVASTAAGDLIAVAASMDAAVSPVFLNLPSVLPQPELRAASGYAYLGGASAVVFSGRLLIAAGSQSDAVTLIDLTAPASPVKRAELRHGVGGFNELDNPISVAVTGNLLAIASLVSDAVTLADISNPASPVLRATMKDGQFGFDYLNGASAVAFNGNLLAIGSSLDSAVTLVDVTTPNSPVLRAVVRDGVNGFDQLAGVSALAWSGSLLIVAAGADSSLTLIDCSVATNPTPVATLVNGINGVAGLGGVRTLAVRNGLLAAGSAQGPGSVTLIDITGPAQPVMRALWSDNQSGLNFLGGVSGIAFAGTNLVVSANRDNAYTILAPEPRFAALASEGWAGIGTIHPAAPLHVVGNVVVENAGSVQMQTDSFAAGFNASAPGLYATAFGSDTVALGDYSLVGGYQNKALGRYSVALGYQSKAYDYFSFAIGNDCIASNHTSFAFGTRALAIHPQSFVWSDGSYNGTAADYYFSSQRQGQFRIRASGGLNILGSSNAPAFSYSGGRKGGFDVPVGYGENTNNSGPSAPVLRLVSWGGDSAEGVLSVSSTGTGNLARFGNASAFVSTLTTNGTWSGLAFNPSSDRAAKENFSPVNPSEVLEKVLALPVSRWNFKAAPGLEHMGPVAQDFHDAFGLNGEDDKHIATVDADGVALAALQGLNSKLTAELQARDAEIRELKSSLASLKTLVERLARERRE